MDSMGKQTGSTPSHPVRVEISLRPAAGIAEGQLSDLALYQLKLMASHLQLVAGFDELLTDADGRWLLVSSRSDAPAVPPGAHALGAVPWSPRTPVVRAGA